MKRRDSITFKGKAVAMTWTPSQLQTERDYLYHERLALLGCFGQPTKEQDEIAKREADEAVGKLREEDL